VWFSERRLKASSSLHPPLRKYRARSACRLRIVPVQRLHKSDPGEHTADHRILDRPRFRVQLTQIWFKI